MTELELRSALREFRIAPHNKCLIEWRIPQPDARWCFYKVTDSPNDSKRVLGLLQGNGDGQQHDNDDSGARADYLEEAGLQD